MNLKLNQFKNGSKIMVKKLIILCMTFFFSSNIKASTNTERSSDESYPVFHTNKYTFDENPETGFIPRLNVFAEEQEKNDNIDEPVCIFVDKERIGDIQYHLHLSGSRLPFRNLIVRVEYIESSQLYEIVNRGFVSLNETVRSIQFIGFERFPETGYCFCANNPNLEVVDISSFISLESIEAGFCALSPVKTIYVAGEKQKKLVEARFIETPWRKRPKVIIKKHSENQPVLNDDNFFSGLFESFFRFDES